MNEATYDIHPAKPRWTHIALRVQNLDTTVAWYAEFTPLDLLDRREDSSGRGAWLGMSDTAPNPFILVIAEFYPEADPFKDAPQAVLTPFAHLGIELPAKTDVDEMARRGEAAGCLTMPATMMPPPIGYICMLSDPDGNTIEYSWDQGVYTTARERWWS